MVLYHNKSQRLYQKQFQLKKGHYMIYIVILSVKIVDEFNILHVNFISTLNVSAIQQHDSQD